MNKTIKRLLSGIITASMLSGALVLPHAASAAEGAPVINVTFDEGGDAYVLQGGASLADGRNGKALSLTSAGDQYATINASADEFAKLSGDYTISIWAKPESSAVWNRIYDLGSSTDKYVFLTVSNGAAPRFAVKNGDEQSVTASDAVSLDDWHNFVITRDGSLTTMYIDGYVAASTSDITYHPSDIGKATNMYLGKSQWPDPYFKGMIDDLQVYNYAIDEGKIHEIAAEAYQAKRKLLIYENNCFIANTKFYQNDSEVFTMSDALKEAYITDKTVGEASASFKLNNAEKDDIKAYAAEYDDKGRLVSVLSNDDFVSPQTASGDAEELSVSFTKKNAENTVKLFVWDDNMKPVSESVPVIKADVSVQNYTADDGNVTAKVYAVTSSNGAETAIDGAEKTESFKSLDEKDIEINIPINKIPDGTSKLIVKLTTPGDETGTAATLYKLASAPVAAPADSDSTTNGAHDPSIVKFPNDDTYYVYSSHHLIFTSKDLINWKKYDFTNLTTNPDYYNKDSETDTNVEPYPNKGKKQILTKTFKFIHDNINTNVNGTYWAPDVIYKEGDKLPYWMYISVSCGLGGRNSAIGLIKSPTPLFWADPDESKVAQIEDAGVVFATKEESGYKTNAIDANIYTDTADNNKQYFVWGSFWGGIQAAPLTSDGKVQNITYTDDTTILNSCKNFGTSIFTQKRGVAGPEGAWMIEHGDYRYAFTSYAWLGSNYHTRVARAPLSKTFGTDTGTQLLDANNVVMGSEYSRSAGTVKKDEITGYKLIGSYRLGDGSMTVAENSANDWYYPREAGDAHIYYGPGHNSVINIGNETFYVSHTRKDAVEGAATLQVRKMLFTADGWPVVSPVTYAGEKEQKLPKSMLLGTYDLSSVGMTKFASGDTTINENWTNHSGNRNYDLPILSSKVTLNDNSGKTVTNTSGTQIGTWEFDGDHTITLTFAANGDEAKDEYYKAGDVMTLFAMYSYDKDEAEPVVALTGTDQKHITQFAKKSTANVYKSTPKTVEETEAISIKKSEGGNPALGFDNDGTAYAGDPAALAVDTDNDGVNDKVYMYVGHDTATEEKYTMPEWLCYSSTDMKNWKYESVVMKATDISWRNDDTSAWASQVVKYGDKYYMYYCTWDKTSDGKQSIGVATSSSPTGPFTDPLGKPLVAGTFTVPETSGWNDIDPTVLIDTDDKGAEHRYLAWGNGKYYICELNENMTSIKDLDGDEAIVMHKDVKERTIKSMGNNEFREAPWLYKRDGRYYLFFAANWREEMAYAMMDEPMGRYDYKQTIMPPTATSNTNHPAVIDFGGKTYFIYHNGMLPHGSGFRRSVCIQELEFDENGYVYPLTESSIGLSGTASFIKTSNSKYLGHDAFRNSLADGSYPLSVPVTVSDAEREYNTAWEIVAAKSVPSGGNTENFVSLQSVDKPGLYISVTDGDVKLAQDADGNQGSKMTFKTVKGLDGSENSVSFESVSEPGKFLTVLNKEITTSYGTVPADSSFTIDTAMAKPEAVINTAAVEPEPEPAEDITQDFNNADASWSAAMGSSNLSDSNTYSGAVLYLGSRSGGDNSTKWSISSSGGVDGSKALMMTSGRFADGNRGPRIQLAAPEIPNGYTVTGKVSIKLGSADAEVFYNDSSSAQATTSIKSSLSATEWTDFEVSITNDNDTYTRVIKVGGNEAATDYIGSFPVIWGTATGSTNYTVLFDNISIKTTSVSGATPAPVTLPTPAAKFEFEDNLTDSVSGENGTLTGPNITDTAEATAAAFVDGNGGGKAVSFTGAGSYGVELPCKPSGSNYTVSFDAYIRDASTNSTSMVFWVNYDGGTLLGGDDNARWISITPKGHWLQLADAPLIWSRDVTDSNTDSAKFYALYGANNNKLALNEWHNITVTASGTKGTLYIDKAQATSGNIADIIDTTTKMYLGTNAFAADTPFNGAIDNFILFNETLSASQVKLIGSED